ASADGRSVFDERGHRIATMAKPLHTDVRTIGDGGLLVVENELYRNGRRITSYGEGMSILGASGDGSVLLLQRDETRELVVHHRGVPHFLSKDLTGVAGSGVVSPDGGRILFQRDRGAAIVIDAATRRPLARLDIVAGAEVFNWRTAYSPRARLTARGGRRRLVNEPREGQNRVRTGLEMPKGPLGALSGANRGTVRRTP